MKFNWVVFTGLFAALSSCATMNEEQCKKANWLEIGRGDGSSGQPSSRIAEHSKACAKHGIKADAGEYDKGYQEGVRTYCTPENAMEIGRSGKMSFATCPKDLEADFNKSWRKGRDEFDKEVAAAEKAKQNRELEQKRSEFFSLQARGGICDASASVGVCFVFSGTDYADKQKNQGNLMACRLFKGEYRPIGSCSREEVIGRCSIVKGTPQEYHLYYYNTGTVDQQVATKDCADSKSSIHSHGAGHWTAYPR